MGSRSRSLASRAGMLPRAALLLCLVAVSHQLSITEFVVPSVVQSGEDVELRCQYELSADESEAALFVKWWLAALNSSDDRTQLYQRIAGQPGASVRHDITILENDTIVLLNVTPADSGVYECEVSNIDEQRKHQQLIVFTEGSGPQLNVSTVADGPDEDQVDDVLIECQADDVAPLPDFKLTINGEEIDLQERIEGPDAEGLFDIYGNATLSRAAVDGADVVCELRYADADVTHEPFVDSLLYDPSGARSTPPPEDATEPDATPDSLQNSRDDGSNMQTSWLLLVAGTVAALCSY